MRHPCEGLPPASAPPQESGSYLHPSVAGPLARALAADALRRLELSAGTLSSGGEWVGRKSRIPPDLLDRWRELTAAEAEQFFLQLMQPGAKPWSMRQRHMMQVLQSVVGWLDGSSEGRPPGLVVWGHSSSLGDARHCDIGWRRGEVNLGQLAREQLPEGSVFSIGFSTSSGSCLEGTPHGDAGIGAAQLRPCRTGSYEEVFHSSGLPMFVLNLQQERVKEVLEFPKLTRVVGERYMAGSDEEPHYYDVSLPNQYDLLVYIDTVTAAAND